MIIASHGGTPQWMLTSADDVPADREDRELAEVPDAPDAELEVPRLVQHHPDQRRQRDVDHVVVRATRSAGHRGREQCSPTATPFGVAPPISRRSTPRSAIDGGRHHSLASSGLPNSPVGLISITIMITTNSTGSDHFTPKYREIERLEQSDDVGGEDRAAHAAEPAEDRHDQRLQQRQIAGVRRDEEDRRQQYARDRRERRRDPHRQVVDALHGDAHQPRGVQLLGHGADARGRIWSSRGRSRARRAS